MGEGGEHFHPQSVRGHVGWQRLLANRERDDMNLTALLNETADSATSAKFGIIRMRCENENFTRKFQRMLKRQIKWISLWKANVDCVIL
jgi:hypothetical protein